MSDKQIIDSNKMIARFMGYEYYPWNHIDSPYKDGIKHYDDWSGWKSNVDVRSMTKINMIHGISGKYLCRFHTDLRYNTDWNRLMEVIDIIEKIDTIGISSVFLTRTPIKYTMHIYSKMDDNSTLFLASGEHKDSKIMAHYECVVNFIKWFNEESGLNK